MRGIKALATSGLGLASLLGVACSAPAEAALEGPTGNAPVLRKAIDDHGAAAKYLPQPALAMLDVAAADLNGDGRLDLVTVADETGQPVGGADVSVAMGLGTLATNAAGEVTFDVPAGAEVLRIEARPSPSQGSVELYVADDHLENAVTIGRSKVATINVIGDLENPMSFTLSVLDPADNPVPGVAVDVDVELRDSVTGADGTAAVDVPTDGRVAIEARTATAVGVWDRAPGSGAPSDKPAPRSQDRGMINLQVLGDDRNGGDDEDEDDRRDRDEDDGAGDEDGERPGRGEDGDRKGNDRGKSARADDNDKDRGDRGKGKVRNDDREDNGKGHSVSISILSSRSSTSP